jgi:hypothetical protein
MADTDVRVIDVKLQGLDDNIRSMLDLQKYIKQVSAEIKAFKDAESNIEKLSKKLSELEKAGKQNTQTYKDNKKALEDNQKFVKANSDAYIQNTKVLTESNQILKTQKYEIGEVIRVQNQQKGSIVELRAQEKLLQEEYINLSRLQRNGLEGKALQDSLRQTREEIREASMAAGDFRTNVGNYSGSILDAVGKMGGFGNAANAMKGGLDGIKMGMTGALGPFGLLLLLIEPLIKLFGQTAFAGEGVRKVTAGIKNVMFELVNVVKLAIDSYMQFYKALGNILTLDFEGAMENFVKIGDNVSEAYNGVADAFTDAYNAQAEMISIAKENNALNLQEAKTQTRIAEIMKLTSGESKIANEEKIKMLKEMSDLQKRDTKDRIALIDREIAAFELQNKEQLKNGANKEELEKKLNELQIKRQNELTKEINIVSEAIVKQGEFNSKIEAEREAAHKEYLAQQKQRADTAFEIRELELQFEKDLLKQGTDLLKLELEKRLNEIKYNENLTAKEKIRLRELAEKESQDKIKELQTKFADEQFTKEIDKQAKIVELQLSAIKDGGEAELMLKFAQLDIAKQKELKEAEKLGIDKNLIEKKYIQLNKEAVEANRLATLAKEKKTAQDIANAKLEILQADLLNRDLTEAEHYQKTIELERAKFEAELEQKRLDNESTYLLEAEYKARIAELEIAEADRVKAQQDARIASTGAMLGAFGDLINAFDDQSEASAQFAKAVALFQIGIDTAEAISGVTKMSVKGSISPIDMGIKIATGIALVMANIMKATKLITGAKQPKKAAKGAIITGDSHLNGGVTFTGDNGQTFEAEGNEALFIINKRSTRAFDLLNKMNTFRGYGNNLVGKNYFDKGGVLQVAKSEGDKQNQLDIFQNALASMPAPIVSVEEVITRAGQLNNVVNTAEF